MSAQGLLRDIAAYRAFNDSQRRFAMRRWGWRWRSSPHHERAPIRSMKTTIVLFALAMAALVSISSDAEAQQALPTATQSLQLSVFGGVGGVFTGLRGGKNFDVLAGADLGLPPVRGMRPEIEVSGV